MEQLHAPQVLLEPGGKVVGGVAGNGQNGAARPLQHPAPGQEGLIAPLGIAAQNGPGTVGDPGIVVNQRGEMVLVLVGVGIVHDALAQLQRGLGAHAAQDTQLRSVVCHGLLLSVGQLAFSMELA